MNTTSVSFTGILLALLAGVAVNCKALTPSAHSAEPWMHTFAPARQLYVSPTGNGDGASQKQPMDLVTAATKAQPGDLYWLLSGSYNTGSLQLTSKGTKEKPIVYRAQPGQRATIVGSVVIEGDYNWVWGLEVTDPKNTAKTDKSGSICVSAPGAHVINNIIHDTWHCGLGGWDTGPDHVYYGNIIYRVGNHTDPGSRCYPLYTQNRFATNGVKYIVQNMLLDVRPDIGGPGYDFHAYTKSGYLSGFYVSQNIMREGRFILGGYNEPADHNTVVDNVFYKMTDVAFGYRRPTQVVFQRNYLARSYLADNWFWGKNGEKPLFQKPGPNVFTDNTISLAPDVTVQLCTSGYNPDRTEGTLPLDPSDTFDRNTYAGGFQATLKANGKNSGPLDLVAWQKATAEAGKAFDANSKLVPVPNSPTIFVFANEYEPGRGHIAIFNWSKADQVKVDLSKVLRPGDRFEIHDAKTPYEKPVVTGQYREAVNVPTAGQECAVYLVTKVK